MKNVKEAAVAWIPHNGKVLAVSRRDIPEDMGLPGGKLENGETSLEALIREVKEETGVEVRSATLVFQRSVPGEVDFLTSLYLVDSFEGIPKNVEEGISVRWIDPKELLKENCTFRNFNMDAFEIIRKRM